MHCTNCGWNNPLGATVCEKCQQPLPAEQRPETAAPTVSRPTVTFQQPPVQESFTEQKTVPQGQAYQPPTGPSTQGEDAVPVLPQKNGVFKTLFFVLLPISVLLLILTLTFYSKNASNEAAVGSWKGDYLKLSDEHDFLKNHINQLSELQPIIITDILMGNETYNGKLISGYGKKIYSSQTQYLCARLKYKTVSKYKSDDIRLYYKLYAPSGKMSTGSSSPKGYTSSDLITISSSKPEANVFGWGSGTSGNWSAGNYKFEVYYKDRCIGVKTFTIY